MIILIASVGPEQYDHDHVRKPYAHVLEDGDLHAARRTARFLFSLRLDAARYIRYPLQSQQADPCIYIYIYIYIHTCICIIYSYVSISIYIYIYIERERDITSERDGNRR